MAVLGVRTLSGETPVHSPIAGQRSIEAVRVAKAVDAIRPATRTSATPSRAPTAGT